VKDNIQILFASLPDECADKAAADRVQGKFVD
jgi:hypothetical protein